MSDVLYSCHACGIVKRSVSVPDRGAEEDILDWMDKVRAAVTANHGQTSPRCKSGEFDLMIPVGAERIGDPTKH